MTNSESKSKNEIDLEKVLPNIKGLTHLDEQEFNALIAMVVSGSGGDGPHTAAERNRALLSVLTTSIETDEMRSLTSSVHNLTKSIDQFNADSSNLYERLNSLTVWLIAAAFLSAIAAIGSFVLALMKVFGH